MVSDNLSERIREKIEQKMDKVSRKLERLRDDEAIYDALGEIEDELETIESRLEDLLGQDDVLPPGLLDRLDAQRERLLAKQERLTMKLELRQEMRDRLEASLEEMHERMEESLREVQASIREQGWTQRMPPGYPQAKSPAGSASPKMQEERRKILGMVEKGNITAEEASQLLEAVRDREEHRRRRKPRWVRIRVTDTDEDRVRVNLTLPVGLVRAGLRAGGRIAGVEGLDTAGLEDMLNRGEIGQILDVRDDKDGERVEIFVE